MICLIDADSLVYRVAYSFEKQAFEELADNPFVTDEDIDEAFIEVQERIDRLIDNMLRDLSYAYEIKQEDIEFMCFLTTSKEGFPNFRYNIDPNYKSSRKGKPKPYWYQHIRDYLIEVYGAIDFWSIEADDGISILARLLKNVVVCHIDKDLNHIPGIHYNMHWKTKEEDIIYAVEPNEARYLLWFQTLAGDSSDDIKGIPMVADVKAAKILKDITQEYNGNPPEEVYINTVKEAYKTHYLDGMNKIDEAIGEMSNKGNIEDMKKDFKRVRMLFKRWFPEVLSELDDIYNKHNSGEYSDLVLFSEVRHMISNLLDKKDVIYRMKMRDNYRLVRILHKVEELKKFVTQEQYKETEDKINMIIDSLKYD